MSEESPSHIGRYEVLRQVGRGAMGVVYLARDPVIGRNIAIKMLRRSVADADGSSEEREFRSRFLREAQAAGGLSHPNIVTVHDVGEDPATGLPFIAMEFIEGRNLKSYLGEGPLAPAEAARLIADVADALDFAHRHGVIHRDVKPANILLHDDGRVKITDFGIARVDSAHVVTNVGQLVGTPRYMSPEQVSGSAVDGRSDVFSLGMVLYETLTRRLPFSGDNLSTITYKIAHESFAPPSRIAEGLPPEFDEVVARALAKAPWNRYQRAHEMAEALRRLAGLHRDTPAPAVAPPPEAARPEESSSYATRATPVPRRTRTSSSAAAVVVPAPRAWPGRWPALALGLAGYSALLVLTAFPRLWLASSPAATKAPVRAAGAAPPSLSTLLSRAERLTGGGGNAARSAAAPAAPGAAASGALAGPGRLDVDFSSSLPGGSLAVEIDGRQRLLRRFRQAETVGGDLSVPPGRVRARVTLSSAGMHASRSVENDMAPGQRRTLRIRTFRGQLVVSIE